MSIAKFDIRRSNKTYIEGPEHFIVVCQHTVFLRIVGQEGSYSVMTATAAEDTGEFRAFDDQFLLNEVASSVSKQLGIEPGVKTDFHEREYVEICKCEYLSDAYRAADLFFDKLNRNSESASD